MRHYPKTQLKTLVIALRQTIQLDHSGSKLARQICQLSTGIMLCGSAIYANAQTVAIEPEIPLMETSSSAQSSAQIELGEKIDAGKSNFSPANTTNNNTNLNEVNSSITTDSQNNNSSVVNPNSITQSSTTQSGIMPSPFDAPIDLAPIDINSLMQQAEAAKQQAATDASRVTAPSTSSAVSEEVEQVTRAELITSSITNGLGAPEPEPVEVREVDSIDEQSKAEKELQDAREDTQVLADHADVSQDKQPDEIIAANADVLKSDSIVPTPEKPNIVKRVWYKFWPPKIVLAAALPTIDVVVVGASDLQAKNIRARLEQYTQEAFSDFRASLPQLRAMAREASEAVGFYSSEFRFEQINNEKLRVRVTPNDPVMVTSQDIRYQGEANQDRTFLYVKRNPDLFVGDQMNDDLYEKTKGRIGTVATEKGYFDGYWVIHDVKVTLPENTADITLDYDSGERYKLGAVVFKNADPDKDIPVKAELLRQLVPFVENEEYGANKVTTLSRNLSDTRWFNNVQVDVTIPDPIVKPIELPADANIDDLTVLQRQALAIKAETSTVNKTGVNDEQMTSGVDESQFAGVGKEDDTPAQRNRMAQQDLTEAQIKEQKRLADMEKIRQTKVIPVVVTVNTDDPNSAEVGIGYGTDTEFRIRGQYRKALINDRGHSVEANIELSTIRQAFDARYNLPYKHPLEDTVSIFGGYEREQRRDKGKDLGLEIDTATVGVERAIKPKGSAWQHTISGRYRLDELNRKNKDVDQSELPAPFNLRNSRFQQQSLLFGYGINKTETVGRIDPVQAFRQFYQLEVGSKSLLTDTDLAILRAGWRVIHSFGENNDHQLVGRADIASIFTKDFEEVPYNLRFFAGGDQSIRGYDYKSLSTEQNGYLVGGQNLAVGSLEYNYQFKPKWRGAIFVDAGNAFDNKFNDPVKVGAGFGVRWSSPVGPIRVDVGAGVSEKSVPIRLHFFIGPQL